MKKLSAIPLALLGILLTHNLTYRLLSGNASDMHSLLDSTGHSWSNKIPQIFILLTISIVLVHKSNPIKHKAVTYKSLLALQIISFITLEVSERLFSGIYALPSLKILILGSVLQIPVSLALYYLLKVVIEPALSLLKDKKSYTSKNLSQAKKSVPLSYINLFKLLQYLEHITGISPPLLKR